MTVTLILATVLSFVNVHSQFIGKQILKWINRPKSDEKNLFKLKAELRSQQATIRISDDFAKYSKLQRKINSIDEELRKCQDEKSGIVLHLSVTYGLRLSLGILLFIISIVNRYNPVFKLDDELNFAPLTSLISYPNEANYVSFHFWVMCCTVIAKFIKI